MLLHAPQIHQGTNSVLCAGIETSELSKEVRILHGRIGLLFPVIDEKIRCHTQNSRDLRDLVRRRPRWALVFELPNIALAGLGHFAKPFQRKTFLLAQFVDFVADRVCHGFLNFPFRVDVLFVVDNWTGSAY